MALSFSVFNKFKAIDGVSAPFRKMRKNVGMFGKKTVKEFKRADRASRGFSRRLKGLAATAATLVSITAITAGLADAVRVGAEFEQTLVNAAAKFGPVAKKGTLGFQALEDAAAKAGKTTEFSAVQAAEGLNFLAMAGFNVDQSIAALPGVIDLATAANLELGRASDIATDTLGAFNLAVKDSIQLQKNLARVSDVMAKTATTANVDMEQLFETFTEAGPIATSLGADIETVAAMAGVLGNAGIKASKAGTTLKNVFTRLAAATPEATKQLENLGVQLKDESGGFRDVFDILEDLNTGLSELGEVEKAAVLKDIFGKIPLAGVNILMAKGADGLREYRKQLENSTGAAQDMAAVMRDTLGNRFKIFQSTLEGFKITVFKTLSDQIGLSVTSFTDLIRIADEWLQLNKDEVQAVLINIFAAFAALGAVVGTLGKWLKTFINDNKFLVPILTTIISLTIAWKTAVLLLNFTMKANPIGVIITGIIAWMLVIKTAIKHIDFFIFEIKNLWQWFTKIITHPVVSGALAIFAPFIGIPILIAKNWKKLLNVFGDIMNKLKPLLQTFKKIKDFDIGGKIARFLGFGGETPKKIKDFDIGGKIARFLGFGGETPAQEERPEREPVSPNAGLLNTIREERLEKGSLDVNFNNLPKGTEIDETNMAPGFTLNTGFAGAT